MTDAFEGGCTCRAVRYRLTSRPLFVHCCHCRWCQRETGTAFALNALIERERVELLCGEPETVPTPSLSGVRQRIVRCPACRIAIWSHYGSGPVSDAVRFVRVGTLDEPDRLPPDIHIFTTSKQPWVVLDARRRSSPSTTTRSSAGRPRASRGAARCAPRPGSRPERGSPQTRWSVGPRRARRRLRG
jgi:hypothetical protein